MYKVVNATEKLAWDVLKEMLRTNKLKCDCDKCRSDIVALALSQKLKPHYVTIREDEELFLTGIFQVQIRIDVIAALSWAIQKVEENPRHVSDDEQIRVFDVNKIW